MEDARLYADTSPTDAGVDFLDALPLPCCCFNSALEICDISALAAQLFGCEAAELIGKTPLLWQAINIGDKKLFTDLLQDVL